MTRAQRYSGSGSSPAALFNRFYILDCHRNSNQPEYRPEAITDRGTKLISGGSNALSSVLIVTLSLLENSSSWKLCHSHQHFIDRTRTLGNRSTRIALLLGWTLCHSRHPSCSSYPLYLLSTPRKSMTSRSFQQASMI